MARKISYAKTFCQQVNGYVCGINMCFYRSGAWEQIQRHESPLSSCKSYHICTEINGGESQSIDLHRDYESIRGFRGLCVRG